jgi:hypothetical protein
MLWVLQLVLMQGLGALLLSLQLQLLAAQVLLLLLHLWMLPHLQQRLLALLLLCGSLFLTSLVPCWLVLLQLLLTKLLLFVQQLLLSSQQQQAVQQLCPW